MALGTDTALKSNADAVIGIHISAKIKATFENRDITLIAQNLLVQLLVAFVVQTKLQS